MYLPIIIFCHLHTFIKTYMFIDFWEFSFLQVIYTYINEKGPSYTLLSRPAQSWVRLRWPVIQANGRLTYEDDLRSGGLLWFISMNASIRTELADSMVTPGEPGGD